MNVADQIPVPYKKWLISHIDSTNHSDLYCYSFKNDKSTWSWISEKFQTHPRLGKRLCEIKHYNQYK